jgi:hypothetical protein
MFAVKEGVQISGIQPEIIFALIAINSIFEELGVQCVITSGKDSDEHMASSLHYKGKAVDLRLPSKYNRTPNIDLHATNLIRSALGKEFDIVLESDHPCRA